MELAPCVAVTGPANSGKSTLLHLLDAALTEWVDAPLSYVVKGNPDGSGRYLLYAPDLREALKPVVKGRWTSQTPETIRRWVDEARRSLELVLLDFGGRHTAENLGMLSRCSHYVVLARSGDAEWERTEGMESWVRACEEAGLKAVAKLGSLVESGEARLEAGQLDGTFRGDGGKPHDPLNRQVIEELTRRLAGIALRRAERPYFNLQLTRRWTAEALPELEGLRPALMKYIREKGTLALGGKAPAWAYAAAMHAALDGNPAMPVWIFDPKLPGAFLHLPGELDTHHKGFPQDVLEVSWNGDVLEVKVVTPDRFIPIDCVLNLPGLPTPAGEVPERVTISGALPIWLLVAYSRWARGRGAGEVALWDASTKTAITVWRRAKGAAHST